MHNNHSETSEQATERGEQSFELNEFSVEETELTDDDVEQDDDDESQDGRGSVGASSLRLLTGAYLIYLGWDLLDVAFTGPDGILIGIATILFIVSGAVLLVQSIRKLMKHHRQGRE